MSIYAVDVDGDRLPDVLAACSVVPGYSRLLVLRNLGGRALSQPEVVPLGFHFYDAVRPADFGGDADLDVATAIAPSLDRFRPCCESEFHLLLNDGKGNLGETLTLNTDYNPVLVAIEDLNGDGLKDLAVGCSDSARVNVFLNEGRAGTPGLLGRFVRGDANGDGTLTLADPVAILNRLFLGGASLPCEKAADADDDGILRLVDSVYILRDLFSSGSPPPAPFPHCGLDRTEDALTCVPRAYCP